MERRRVLTGIGLVLAGMLPGCSGDTNSTGPTDAVERYFEALADGDREAANQVAHTDGEFYIDDDAHPFLEAENLTITETETVDIEQAVESMFAEPEEVHIEDVVENEEAAVEKTQNDHGFTDFEYVRHDASADGLTFNSVYLLFESDDNWVLWSLPTAHM